MMRILQVSAEIFPLLKTGGLADIAGALPQALAGVGCEVRAVLPGFPAIRQALLESVWVGQFHTPWGETVGVRLGRLAGVSGCAGPLSAYVLEAPGLYDRPGNPYEDAQRRPYADNHRRFAALGWAAAHLANGLDGGWAPQLVHCHDWHAGLAPACLQHWPGPASGRVPSVYTVHNLAYQGVFEASVFGELGLPPSAFAVDGLEFHGQVSFMKAGLYYADHLSTVSPSYAREIQTPEQGCGLDGLLRARRDHLSGILNAVDEAVWNPSTDTLIGHRFGTERLAGKALCKAELQRHSGLAEQADAPLFAMVGRLTGQKGLPLVLAGVDEIVAHGGQLLVLGSGEADLEQALQHQSQRHLSRVAVHLGYDEALAHRIFAGSDVTLVPSLFEPCGLTQMYGLKYGSLPLVRGVGGLADTVTDADLATLEDHSATGFVFGPFTDAAYQHALRRAFALYRQPAAWARVRQTGMRQALGWASAAQAYRALYQQLLSH
jgi:starch synthase